MADYSDAYVRYNDPATPRTPRTPTTAELQTQVTALEKVVELMAKDVYANPDALVKENGELKARIKELEESALTMSTEIERYKNLLREIYESADAIQEDIVNELNVL